MCTKHVRLRACKQCAKPFSSMYELHYNNVLHPFFQTWLSPILSYYHLFRQEACQNDINRRNLPDLFINKVVTK